MKKKLICLLLVFTTVIGCAPTNDTPSSSSINISDLINSSSESIVKHSVTFMDGKEVISVI